MAEFTEEQLLEIEKQLSCPEGENGKEMALNMNKGNASMITATIYDLEVQDNDFVLELGHGNCAHLKELMSKASNIRYTGLEISETAFSEAKRINESYINESGARFELYDGQDIPLPNAVFNRIYTVNTLYFWKQPQDLMNEVYRVLKPGGRFIVTFASKEFLAILPFVGARFEAYDEDQLSLLAMTSGFEIKEIKTISEDAETKTGEKMVRTFHVAILEKN